MLITGRDEDTSTSSQSSHTLVDIGHHQPADPADIDPPPPSTAFRLPTSSRAQHGSRDQAELRLEGQRVPRDWIQAVCEGGRSSQGELFRSYDDPALSREELIVLRPVFFTLQARWLETPDLIGSISAASCETGTETLSAGAKIDNRFSPAFSAT